jgi:mono/diheme cytochrome c family protein
LGQFTLNPTFQAQVGFVLRRIHWPFGCNPLGNTDSTPRALLRRTASHRSPGARGVLQEKELYMTSKSIVCLLVLFLIFACVAATAQTVKKTPVTPTSPASGQEMYATYCASCHGLGGKGDGPAAPALKKTPANLTELTKRNQGKFPELKVYGTIRGDSNTPAHGSKDMPIWGSVFQSLSHGDQAQVQLRISNLTKYIESIQVK